MIEATAIADAPERARALDPTRSFIVQAPAGSGKTELLIQRYLKLLAVVSRPESIVAITFTRKAAGEMLHRVLAALESAGRPQPAKPHQRLTWELARAARERDLALGWGIRENPRRLEFRTIDSLSSMLASRMPWLSRFGAPPRITEQAADLYQEAARNTVALLESQEYGEPLARLLDHLDNNTARLEELLAAMLARREQWLRLLWRGGDRRALEAALADAVREGLAAARAAVPAHVAAFAAERTGLAAVPGTAPDDQAAWLAIANLLVTTDGDWRRKVDARQGFPPSDKAGKARMQALLEGLREGGVSPEPLAFVRILPPSRYTDAQWAVIEAQLQVLKLATAQLRLVFEQHGAVDHTEVSLRALAALGAEDDPTDLALALDGRIEHLLVDEFQDTSVSNFELIRRLVAGWEPGDGRTLFLVGDPMQSIYRFREAQVGLFLRAWSQGIGNLPLEPLRLKINFRSAGGLVEWYNRTFQAALPPRDDPGAGAVSYSPCQPDPEAAAAAAVVIHPFAKPADQQEAAAAVELIRERQERDPRAKIAILARSRNHLGVIPAALREAGLRFRAVEIVKLGQLPLIQDLLSLTRALLHPADRIAWLAILRAPWCGLTLADLHALAGGAPDQTVWDLMRDEARLARLSPDGRARLARLGGVLAACLDAPRPRLRGWVEGAWLALGGNAITGPGGNLEDARTFFDLLEELDEGGFADLDVLAARVKDLFAQPDPEAGDGLQLMTIHKAKGLQFDIVILPGLGRGTRPQQQQLLFWLERPEAPAGCDLLLAPIREAGAGEDQLSRYLQEIEKRRADHEVARLLYVAATRAKGELHLFGQARLKETAGGLEAQKPAGTFLARIWDAARGRFDELAGQREPGVEPATEAIAARRSRLRRIGSGWVAPAPAPSVAVARLDLEERGLPEQVSYLWVGETLRHVGTVVHRMLEEIAREGLGRWDAARLRSARPAILSGLRALGVSPADLESAAAKVARALESTLADPRGRWIFSPDHTESASELALTGLDGGELVSIRIDRTFVDASGARWIVDFKTSAHEGGDIEAFLDTELERYRDQLTRYVAFLRKLENRPVRAALYFPLLGGWRELPATLGASQAGGPPDF